MLFKFIKFLLIHITYPDNLQVLYLIEKTNKCNYVKIKLKIETMKKKRKKME